MNHQQLTPLPALDRCHTPASLSCSICSSSLISNVLKNAARYWWCWCLSSPSRCFSSHALYPHCAPLCCQGKCYVLQKQKGNRWECCRWASFQINFRCVSLFCLLHYLIAGRQPEMLTSRQLETLLQWPLQKMEFWFSFHLSGFHSSISHHHATGTVTLEGGKQTLTQLVWGMESLVAELQVYFFLPRRIVMVTAHDQGRTCLTALQHSSEALSWT